MPPKKKKQTLRCSICNILGHTTAECDDTSYPVVGSPESTLATLSTAHIPEGPLQKRIKREPPNSAYVDAPVPATLSMEDCTTEHSSMPHSPADPYAACPSYGEVDVASSHADTSLSLTSVDLLLGYPETKHEIEATVSAETSTLLAHNVTPASSCGQAEILAHDQDILSDTTESSSEDTDEKTLSALIDQLTANIDPPNECACCHRCDTAEYPLKLKIFSAIRGDSQSYGDLHLPHTPFVCNECTVYLELHEENSQWAHAWPAVIYTFLTSDTFSCDPKKFMEMLPQTIRNSYVSLVPTLSEKISAVLNLPSKFVDGTHDLINFKSHLFDHAGILASKLNATCFPSVKCPMGCNTYLDGEVGKDVDYLPLSHYLSFICPEFTSFQADPNCFRGARPDWPSRGEYEGFKFAPTLIVDAEKGLCVVTCAQTIHADGRSLYIHVPRNPVLGSTSELCPDLIAPVSVNPHLVRPGRSDKMNSSHAVFREYGDTSGTSCFSLTPKPYLDGPCSVPQIESMGLALNQREEILHTLVKAKTLPNEFFHKLEESYEKHRLDDEVVEEAKATGTYVNFHDASLMMMQYHKKLMSNSRKKPQRDLRPIGKDVLKLVHPGNKIGRLPFKLALLGKPRSHNGLLLHNILTLLLHSTHLYQMFLTKLEIERPGSIHHLVQSCVLKIASGIKLSEALKIEKEILRMSYDKVFCGNNCQAILALLCGVKTVSIHCSFQGLESIADGSEDVLLVDSSAVRSREAPQTLCNGRWQLMLSLAYRIVGRKKSHFEFDFRWSPELKWHHCSSDTTTLSQVGDNPRPFSWNILLYIETDSVLCISKYDFLQFYGAQTTLKCSKHRALSMISVLPDSSVKCCLPRCPSSARYRCSKGYGQKWMPCAAGVCLEHARLILMSGERKTFIDPPLDDITLPELTHHDDVDSMHDATMATLDDLQPLFPDEMSNVAEAHSQPLDALSGQLPVATEGVNLSYSRGANSTPGHFLLNTCLHMSRVEINEQSSASFQNVLTRVNDISPKESRLFLYPEGLLFPTIFWAAVGRSVIGALPSVFYSPLGRKSVNGEFASLDDHLRVRLLDMSLLTAHDPNYLAFCFDIYLNSLLRSNKVLVALHQGLEHVNRASVMIEASGSSLKSNETDDRIEVKRLSAIVDENPWDFFLTLTCNDSETMGVAPIRRALEQKYHGKELDKQLQNACPLLCRAWARTVHYLFEFLVHGKEKIFGELKNVWYRFEFQNAEGLGNKPCVHAGITLKDRSCSVEERMKRTHDNLDEMFNKNARTDMISLLSDGLVKDQADFVKLFNLADRFTQSKCANSKLSFMKKMPNGGNERYCVPKYDNETQKHLSQLGFGTKKYPPEPNSMHKPCKDEVKKTTVVESCYSYDAVSRVYRVPSHGRIFAMLRSTVKVQICDHEFARNSFAEYAARADEKRKVIMTFCKKTTADVDQPRDLCHTKISVSKKEQGDEMREDATKRALCRTITATEMVWFTHQLPFVGCTAHFVNCFTHNFERRQAMYRKQAEHIRDWMNAESIYFPLGKTDERACFPRWRRFTRSQTFLMNSFPNFDENTFLFSVRPPELREIMRLTDYLKWFSVTLTTTIAVAEDVSEFPWIDAKGRRVRVRKRYVNEVLRFFESLANRAHPSPGTRELYLLFKDLDRDVVEGRNSECVHRFVDMAADRDVVIVYNCIEPKSTSNFFFHLLLTLGSFVTELDLLRGPTLLHAFQYAGLIADADNPTEEEALSIIRQYVITQLRCLPYDVEEFSRILRLAMDRLLDFFETRGRKVHNAVL
ncbi:uncharacterized protein LOC108683367 isoform X2 [Hyalella azteca]|uniref:Uncharacterized protein LOC108683367 isoform X2 n=1 Tax=Hyalella azteca TaxID=294128 RepID=A0A979FQE3_HYAAZ|nr:uncharacterized protein LOC108683367 isoform X2 [Hyalella azteca]